ncbi:hypothetical protein VNO77_23681 [Canavalia gladiata]|uniref:Secreted protein n=1 Tax=Canavalia gladiata TaxID=3824 RepID=A0AAN9QBR3_CANGL
MCLVSIFSPLGLNLVGWSRVDARVTVGVESRGLGWVGVLGGGGEMYMLGRSNRRFCVAVAGTRVMWGAMGGFS